MPPPKIDLHELQQQVAALSAKEHLLEDRVRRLQDKCAQQEVTLTVLRRDIVEKRARSRLSLRWATHQAAANKRLRADAPSSVAELEEGSRIEEELIAKHADELREPEELEEEFAEKLNGVEGLETGSGAENSQATVDEEQLWMSLEQATPVSPV